MVQMKTLYFTAIILVSKFDDLYSFLRVLYMIHKMPVMVFSHTKFLLVQKPFE